MAKHFDIDDGKLQLVKRDISTFMIIFVLSVTAELL